MDVHTQFHFVTYVCKAGKVWEIDGRRDNPVVKADCPSLQEFGVIVSGILQKYTAVNPDTKYSLMALAPAD